MILLPAVKMKMHGESHEDIIEITPRKEMSGKRYDERSKKRI